ncbi:spore germination protein PE [Paenibacillus endophyticus]|uniref:Spore germination protein PE n=1 Tax=Paenibacillus endophyticus TaxID=1294268 RepID=A0A7W5GDC3_9BACL|nr:spore germination protein GerPE [Paenibacillus endophyticus]MBB3156279.1 spore germination protein PE [Paenibacillus endophyticus]
MNVQDDHTYPIRTANVGSICIISVAQAGTVQFGDRAETHAKIRALALQRQEDHTTAGDIFFESYSLFYLPLPALVDPDYDNGEVVSVIRANCSPNITVGNIQVIAAGSSASIQIGNGMEMTGESRIKHIRQYPRPKPVPPVGCPF